MGRWPKVLPAGGALFAKPATFGFSPYSNHAICWKHGQRYPDLRMQPCMQEDLSKLKGCPWCKGGELCRKWHKLRNAGQWREALKILGKNETAITVKRI